MFELNEEQRLLKSAVREFVEKEVIPISKEIDQKDEVPKKLIQKIVDLGLIGMIIPEKYGGGGTSYRDYVIAVEEISRGLSALGTILSVQNTLYGLSILEFGTEEQKEEYLPPLCSGKKFGCFAITEPEAGSDIASITTRARKEGNYYILNGRKEFITMANVADVAIVFAKTDPSAGHRGISAFLVKKDSEGFIVEKPYDKLGGRGVHSCPIVLKDVRVPKEDLLGKEGYGFFQALKILSSGRISVAARSVGLAQFAFEKSVEYAKNRKQFGKPIAEFQLIRAKIAEMAVKLDAARLLVHRAAYLKDSGKEYTLEASMAKLFAARVAREIANEALQIHGGYGYIKEYDVERIYRDAKMGEITEGTNEIQILIIANEILRRSKVT
ncbi:MAG: acyl-CoA dehydrogenase family protein [Archaeoglobaceae archaeon]